MSPPRNANPSAGGAGAHDISQIDAVPITRNQRTEQENASIAATAILTAARKRDIHVRVSPDQNELILVASLRVPRNVRRWFEIWLLDKFRDEVIAIIAGRRA